jgi:hypothetical protein
MADQMPSLEIDPDKVCFLIVMTREFENAEPAIDEDTKATEAEDEIAELGHSPEESDATFDEIKSFIGALNWDEQCQLVALAWLGRGDFSIEEWQDAVTAANDEHNERTADYLLGMPLLPDYLTEGLAAFDITCDEVDRAHL